MCPLENEGTFTYIQGSIINFMRIDKDSLGVFL